MSGKLWRSLLYVIIKKIVNSARWVVPVKQPSLAKRFLKRVALPKRGSVVTRLNLASKHIVLLLSFSNSLQVLDAALDKLVHALSNHARPRSLPLYGFFNHCSLVRTLKTFAHSPLGVAHNGLGPKPSSENRSAEGKISNWVKRGINNKTSSRSPASLKASRLAFCL